MPVHQVDQEQQEVGRGGPAARRGEGVLDVDHRVEIVQGLDLTEGARQLAIDRVLDRAVDRARDLPGERRPPGAGRELGGLGRGCAPRCRRGSGGVRLDATQCASCRRGPPGPRSPAARAGRGAPRAPRRDRRRARRRAPPPPMQSRPGPRARGFASFARPIIGADVRHPRRVELRGLRCAGHQDRNAPGGDRFRRTDLCLLQRACRSRDRASTRPARPGPWPRSRPSAVPTPGVTRSHGHTVTVANP